MSRMSSVLGVIALTLVGLAGTASAQQPPSEAYPPSAPILEIDPLACNATKITGEVEVVQPGSTVTVTLTSAASGWKRLAPVAGPVTVTATAKGEAFFTLALPTGTIGSFVVTATGVDAAGNPFTLSGKVKLVECTPLPSTGSNATGPLLRLGALAAMLGAMLVVGTSRRRRAIVSA